MSEDAPHSTEPEGEGNEQQGEQVEELGSRAVSESMPTLQPSEKPDFSKPFSIKVGDDEPVRLVNDKDRALAEATDIDNSINEARTRTQEEYTETPMSQVHKEGHFHRAKYAGRRHLQEVFDQKHELNEPIKKELEEDNVNALLLFGKNVIENHRTHKETLTPNQEMFEAIAKFAELHPEALERTFWAVDRTTWTVKSNRDSLVLQKYPPSREGLQRGSGLDISYEEWYATPWQEERDDFHGGYEGAMYSYKESRSPDEEGFDLVTVEMEKSRLSFTVEEAEDFIKMLEGVQPIVIEQQK